MKDKKEKILLFYKTKTYAYLRLDNGRFYNGYVKETSEDDFIFIDDVLGDVPVMFSELHIVDTSNKPRKVIN